MRISISRVLLLLAALIALLTAGLGGYRVWSRPLHLRVAAGPQDSPDAKLMIAFNRMLGATHASVRLDVVPTADVHDNNVRLGKGDVDMAVVRLDDPLPTKAGVVALLRTNLLIAVAPSHLKIDALSDIRHRRVGVIARSPLDEPGFLRVLDAFGIKPADIHLETISADKVFNLTRNGQIEVVVIAGAPSDPEVQAVVNAVAGSRKNPPTILSVDLGDVDSSTPAASAETIGDNAFPRLGIPDDEVDTIGVKTALVANTVSTGPLRERIYNNAINELTRALIERHGELARDAPLASLISAPDKDDDARFPVHPGTNDYLNDTDTSWSTLIGDDGWTLALIGGAISSVFAASVGFLTKGSRSPLQGVLARLNDVASRAEASTDSADAAALSQELRGLSVEMTGLGYTRGSGYEEFAPLQVALENAREAIAALRADPTRLRPNAGTWAAAQRPEAEVVREDS